MTVAMRGRQAPEAKVEWLASHPELWAHLSDADIELLWLRNRPIYRAIAKEMQRVGLFSTKTSMIDMHIGRLIQRARAAK